MCIKNGREIKRDAERLTMREEERKMRRHRERKEKIEKWSDK